MGVLSRLNRRRGGEGKKDDDKRIREIEGTEKGDKTPTPLLTFLLTSPPSRPLSLPGFKAILDNSEIQHRVLKELPLLGAIEGFSKIRANRRLSAEEVGKGGREGRREVWVHIIQYFKKKSTQPNSTFILTHHHSQTKEGSAQGIENLMTLAQDAFVNNVRRLPSVPPSLHPLLPFLPSFPCTSTLPSRPVTSLLFLPPFLPPSPGERPRKGLGDGREDGHLLRPYHPGKEGGRKGGREEWERQEDRMVACFARGSI